MGLEMIRQISAAANVKILGSVLHSDAGQKCGFQSVALAIVLALTLPQTQPPFLNLWTKKRQFNLPWFLPFPVLSCTATKVGTFCGLMGILDVPVWRLKKCVLGAWSLWHELVA